jgi:hypothetical protein
MNISSGCIRMLGLDLYKLKKYTQKGFDISILLPELFAVDKE